MRLFAHAGLANWPFDELDPHSYAWIDADCPWDFSLFSVKGGKKSAQQHYRCLPLDQIMAFPVQDLAAENCVLSLWSTAPMLRQQMRVLDAWGFTYKTEMIWRKVTALGKQTFGPGYIVRGSHEPVLIATRGHPPFVAKDVRSCFDGLRREHSRKPEEFYALADRMLPKGRRVSLFSRANRPGWEQWGDEVGKFDAVELPQRLKQLKKQYADVLPLFREAA
ncbi:MT-A70 family methyltransferase [Mesorhizobium sp.]|uniref:MT-A70 family methyltransferase n=1 Tax=Mesorhizobium sp. TaxID=1871066 RepID=UPI0025F449CC|nr:MT-A70 family methyltransferase [Mesorhizobium sp.]